MQHKARRGWQGCANWHNGRDQLYSTRVSSFAGTDFR